MNDPQKPIDNKILVDMVDEAKNIGREGMQHPSTKPVLIGAGVGALGGALILGGPILGALAGAGVMLYKRVRP